MTEYQGLESPGPKTDMNNHQENLSKCTRKEMLTLIYPTQCM